MISLLIAFFLVSVVFSFLCSMWEAALLSITPAYAEIKNQEGSAMGRHLAQFKANIDRPLAAILTLNTIAHTVGAIGVGAQASLIWGDANPLITGLLVPVIVTLAILLLSEIIPKTLGATYWKELAGFTVSSLRLVIFLLAPLVWVCQQLTGLLKRNTEGSIFSRSDFMALAEIGAREGVIEEHESDMIANLMRFESVCAEDIMTPRTVVIAAPQNLPIDQFVSSKEPPRFSRLPTYQNDSKDDITGYVLKDDLLAAMLDERGNQPINSLRREIMIVGEDFPLPELFNRLVERKEHIALVVDEFGGMAGIVTMEDVIETLLGREIIDESDREEDMRVQAQQAWETRAKAQGLVEESYSNDEDETESHANDDQKKLED
ncbi:MAG: hemolysin family protein [Gammaproteobacteria bacterium]|nr:hemolysin family protein [Gammaproteobacteria bacterium]